MKPNEVDIIPESTQVTPLDRGEEEDLEPSSPHSSGLMEPLWWDTRHQHSPESLLLFGEQSGITHFLVCAVFLGTIGLWLITS